MKILLIASSFGALVFLCIAITGFGDRSTLIADDDGFAVLELFTSEGCSSCPAADAFARELERSKGHSRTYILSYHVDYWDHLGWKDRFSSKFFAERQRQYARWLHLESIYTPQLVINGEKEFVGSNRSAISKTLALELSQSGSQPLKLLATLANNQISIKCDPTLKVPNSTLIVALVEKSALSDVRSGENSGRRLSHVQIVRSFREVPLDGASTNEILMARPSDFKTEGWELIGFIQNISTGQITAAGDFDFATVGAPAR